jgi:predicted tellurium resistance membrane protein TerC
MRILARPLAEVVEACLAPRVWVWGVWFGFALRCVALLCGVFVQLHLALFLAGGLFLFVSLSVKFDPCFLRRSKNVANSLKVCGHAV